MMMFATAMHCTHSINWFIGYIWWVCHCSFPFFNFCQIIPICTVGMLLNNWMLIYFSSLQSLSSRNCWWNFNFFIKTIEFQQLWFIFIDQRLLFVLFVLKCSFQFFPLSCRIAIWRHRFIVSSWFQYLTCFQNAQSSASILMIFVNWVLWNFRSRHVWMRSWNLRKHIVWKLSNFRFVFLVHILMRQVS